MSFRIINCFFSILQKNLTYFFSHFYLFHLFLFLFKMMSIHNHFLLHKRLIFCRHLTHSIWLYKTLTKNITCFIKFLAWVLVLSFFIYLNIIGKLKIKILFTLVSRWKITFNKTSINFWKLWKNWFFFHQRNNSFISDSFPNIIIYSIFMKLWARCILIIESCIFFYFFRLNIV